MVWRETKNHFDTTYLCLVNITGMNQNNDSKWVHSYLVSARKRFASFPYYEEVPIPVFRQLLEHCKSRVLALWSYFWH